ncbi:MAG: response regulator [Spirochaetia bacterium]|nr:response regulator [Spirochaetia bacterium]
MKQKILVIDDNPINLKLACTVLAASGYSIVQALNAEEALQLTGIHSFDLILTDLELPGMDGLALSRILKSAPETCEIPIIAVTAFAMKGDEAKAIAAGCDGYITKPINTRTLTDQISAILGRKSEPTRGNG